MKKSIIILVILTVTLSGVFAGAFNFGSRGVDQKFTLDNNYKHSLGLAFGFDFSRKQITFSYQGSRVIKQTVTVPTSNFRYNFTLGKTVNKPWNSSENFAFHIYNGFEFMLTSLDFATKKTRRVINVNEFLFSYLGIGLDFFSANKKIGVGPMAQLSIRYFPTKTFYIDLTGYFGHGIVWYNTSVKKWQFVWNEGGKDVISAGLNISANFRF